MEQQKQKILIIDDEKGMLNIIGDILKDAGFQTFLAENGSQGLKTAKTVVPDLILCDIQMPEMNGYELLNALKEDHELAKIPFVFMTGVNIGKRDQRIGMELGADDYLTKPFSDQDLLSAIESRLRKKQLWQQFVDATMQKTHAGFFLLLSNELQMRVMDILEKAQSLLTDTAPSAEKVRETAQKITISGRRLNRLHENILFYSLLQVWAKDTVKIESLRKEVTESYLSILNSVVLENTRAGIRKDSITLDCTDAAVQISPVDFGKIMDELIDNACKYSSAGSEITISSEEKEHTVSLSVHNEGPAIPDPVRERIVSLLEVDGQEFGEGGTGLGFTIVKTLTELYNGCFTLESSTEAGTTVTVELPIPS